tara:strand:- start:3454 stop:3801 length:348 start_codon:yes stop_codon:yes gene_type:complete
MKVLSTGTSNQTLKIIPRSYVTNVTLKLKDDSTRTETSYSITASTDKNYLVLTDSFNLVEGRYYDMKVLDGANVIYKDKVFCTAQNPNQTTNVYYTPNKDVFTTNDTYDNDYIYV